MRFGLPTWFPYPSAWLNALMLSMLMTGLLALTRRSNGLDSYFAKWSNNPELFTVSVILLLILPIPAIAFFHHFFIGRLISAIPGERTNNIKGLVPGLISWWESLYSWLVFVLSTLIAILFSTPFLPLFQLNYEKIIDTYNQPHKNLQAIFAIFWILSAAIFYQIEYLFKYRLIFADAISSEPESTPERIDEGTNVKPENNQQSEINATEIQNNDQKSPKKTTVVDLIVKYRKLPKRVFTLVLISLISLWIYLFTNLPEVQQSMSYVNQSLENRLEATPEPTPKNNTFEKAIDKGRIAAELTKSAQSTDEWKVVAKRWEQAIRLLEEVPPSSDNYAMAQQKILQYQLHRDFAIKNATLN
jgi:signal transduction histidine kinase